MKIPLTDQFLWDVYNVLEKTGDIINLAMLRKRTIYDVLPFPRSENPIFNKYRRMKNRRQFHDLIYRLKKNNYIKAKNLHGKLAIMITKKGKDKVFRARFKLENVQLQKRKDGKWIMIIFDIPRKHNRSRNLLRSILENLGYKMFQHSVWITPYDVFKKTEELLQWYSLDDYVRIFLVEKV